MRKTTASKRSIAVLDAPSNPGLRPPRPGTEPGCKKRARALRGRGIVERLGAHDAGGLVPRPTPGRAKKRGLPLDLSNCTSNVLGAQVPRRPLPAVP